MLWNIGCHGNQKKILILSQQGGLIKRLISVILYQKKYSCVEKEYSELLCLTKNNSFLQNRHFPVAMVTEWDKGELSNSFLWFNLSCLN